MRERLRGYYRNLLTHRTLPVALAVVSVLLCLPAFWIGWQLDDHYHRLLMHGHRDLVFGPSDMFSSIAGDVAQNRRLMDYGSLPWWTPEEYRVALFRPLSVLTARLDFALWPESPGVMHAHSLLWFGALVAAATLLYRRIMGAGVVAGLAAVLYALDDTHAMPAAWLANRNALLATLFGVLCLVAHDAWRRGGRRWGLIAAPAFLALGLASGELALATAGYLLAYALFLDGAHGRGRLLSLAPSGAVLLAWATLYRVLGYGVTGGGLYVDPAGDPVTFASTFLVRGPVLLLGHWTPVAADWATLLPDDLARAVWLAGLATVAILALALAPLIRKDRRARFWCLGMLLSLLPAAGAFPSNRLLFFVGVGGMGLIALFLEGIREKAGWVPAGRAWRIPLKILAVLFVITHVVLAPLGMPIGAYSPKLLGQPSTDAIASAPDDPAISEQDLVFVNVPDYLVYVSYLPTVRILEDKPFPKRMRVLALGPVAVEMTREDERTVRVRLDGGMFSGALGRLFRGENRPIAVGQEFPVAGMTARVTAVSERDGPSEIVYTFALPLEDPSLRWVRWRDQGFVPFTPPPVGETVRLPAAVGPFEITEYVRRNMRKKT